MATFLLNCWCELLALLMCILLGVMVLAVTILIAFILVVLSTMFSKDQTFKSKKKNVNLRDIDYYKHLHCVENAIGERNAYAYYVLSKYTRQLFLQCPEGITDTPIFKCLIKIISKIIYPSKPTTDREKFHVEEVLVICPIQLAVQQRKELKEPNKLKLKENKAQKDSEKSSDTVKEMNLSFSLLSKSKESAWEHCKPKRPLIFKFVSNE